MHRHWYASTGLVAAAIAVVAFWAGDVARMSTPNGTAPQKAQPPQSSTKTPDAPALTLAEVDHKFLNDEWTHSISTDNFWRNRRRNQPAAAAPSKSRLQGPQPDVSWFTQPPAMGSWTADQEPPRASGRTVSGYRTVCVRMCDGFFFPISFGTSEGSFSRDQSTCSNACPGARLYHYKAGSENPEDMVDASGQAYSKHKNANLFRTQFVESCKCKPHPWEPEATQRHRIYALEDQRRRGNRTVVAELEDLKAKNRPEGYGSNASRNRFNDRNRRRLPASEEQTSTQQTMAGGVSTAPRSDSTRGQGGDRITTATLGPAPSPEPSTTSSIERTRTAASTQPRGMTEAASPSLSPIGRAAEDEANRAAGTANALPAPGAAQAIPAMIEMTGTTEIPVVVTGQAPSPALVSEPVNVPIPQTVTAAPFDPATEPATNAPSRRARRAERQNAAGSRPQGMMNLGANVRPSPGPVQVWRPARDTPWTGRVFQ